MADDLGRGDALRQAVRKLLSVVPAAHRPDATRIAERIVVDPVGWRRTPQVVPHLHALQEAELVDLGEAFVRAGGLDVGELWRLTHDRPGGRGYPVRIRVQHAGVALLERTCADQLLAPIETESVDAETRVLRLTFQAMQHAYPVLLSYGGLVEVLDPAELRSSVASAARLAAARYESD